tara:strand:- start:742 stop:1686 length:945 start_codon:yes stop_codon:yes gene_type:complete
MTSQIKGQDVELDDDENVVEAHDPKNAEEESIASVKTAEKVGKTAVKRKGDKSNSETLVKGKAGSPTEKEQAEDYDFSDDLEALISEEATLSEGFKGKAAIIFEAAIKSKLTEEVERLEAQYETQLQEEVDLFKTDMVEKVDGYLNYVVENWMKENEVAIQNGLRAEIAEEFMDKLQALFVESYIAVPDSKVDLVDDLAAQKDALEVSLDEQTDVMIAMKDELESYKRYEIIREASRGLAETEVEKLVKLSEDLDFEGEEFFAGKVKTIKEAYFKKVAKTSASLVESVDETEMDEIEISGSMAAYVTALRKTNK